MCACARYTNARTNTHTSAQVACKEGGEGEADPGEPQPWCQRQREAVVARTAAHTCKEGGLQRGLVRQQRRLTQHHALKQTARPIAGEGLWRLCVCVRVCVYVGVCVCARARMHVLHVFGLTVERCPPF
jgi:hypothetical protein